MFRLASWGYTYHPSPGQHTFPQALLVRTCRPSQPDPLLAHRMFPQASLLTFPVFPPPEPYPSFLAPWVLSCRLLLRALPSHRRSFQPQASLCLVPYLPLSLALPPQFRELPPLSRELLRQFRVLHLQPQAPLSQFRVLPLQLQAPPPQFRVLPLQPQVPLSQFRVLPLQLQAPLSQFRVLHLQPQVPLPLSRVPPLQHQVLPLLLQVLLLQPQVQLPQFRALRLLLLDLTAFHPPHHRRLRPSRTGLLPLQNPMRRFAPGFPRVVCFPLIVLLSAPGFPNFACPSLAAGIVPLAAVASILESAHLLRHSI